MLKMGSFDTDYFINLEYVKIFCHHCRAVITADPAASGQPVQCHSCGEYLIIPKNRFAPSIVINDFVLHEEIGSGGCGTVFLAYQISLDRYCALKILHNRIISEDKYLHELMQEGRVAGRLNHPNIVQCYSIGEEEGIYFYAMEYVEGKSVKDLLNEKYKISPAKTLDIITQIVNALNYAWNKERLVHRDVKPDNIMINIEGEAKLTDMGLALPAHAIQSTEDDFIKGSPQYISPEQIMDEPQDFRSDIYSLGTVMFRMLTGHFVFKAATAEEICRMHVEEKPVSPAKYSPELPPEICKIVRKMLAKNPENRYANYDSLKKDLLEVREFCDTHTASQEIIAAIKEDKVESIQTDNSKATVFHWLLSLSLVAAFTVFSYLYILKPALVKKEISQKVTDTKSLVEKQEKISLVKETASLEQAKAVVKKNPPKTILKISNLFPDPQGYDAGSEWVEIENAGEVIVDLSKWKISDREGQSYKLYGMLETGNKKKFILPENSISLNNKGDSLKLHDAKGNICQEVIYSETDVIANESLKPMEVNSSSLGKN